mmetsp:Transcript_7560/g.20969  ORF Transcript_7560/g.20969 Transcript_7560/m.20969 type:complete len:409 (+) Transcript_7560:73-1299(+)
MSDESPAATKTMVRRVVARSAEQSTTTPLLADEHAVEANPASGQDVNGASSNNTNNENDAEGTAALIFGPSEPRRPSLRRILNLFLSPVTDEQGNAISVLMGLFAIFVVGSLIGFILPNDSKFPSQTYATVSSCLGYTYFFAWSVSFYPQVWTNSRRRTTQGLSVEFSALNVIGFACYTVYNVVLFTSPYVQSLYKERYGADAKIPVQSNDVAFAVHALCLSSITLAQILYYDGIHATQQMSRPVVLMIVLILVICVGGALMSAFKMHINWLDYVYVLSLCKIAVTLVKYTPQVYLNWKRKSTAGWSVWQGLLDLTGGFLSNLQLVLDCTALGDYSGITGNVAKLLLGQVSIVFDVIFCTQHYVLYHSSSSTTAAADAAQDHPLLSSQETASFHESDENAPEVLSTLT